MANGKRQRATGSRQQATGSRQMAAGKWQRVNGKRQRAKGNVGKNTFWPGHAPWATASSGVPAGALLKLSLARDLPASLRRASKIRKKGKPFSKFNYKYFSAMLFASVVFYPRFFFVFVLSALKCTVIFFQNVSLYQCVILKENMSSQNHWNDIQRQYYMFGIY